MPMLEDLNRQIMAAAGREIPLDDAARLSEHVDAIVEAVKSIELVLNLPESVDYSPLLESLSDAVTRSLEAQSKAMTKALGSLKVEVAAPKVTVEAPKVEVNPVFEANMPDPKGVYYAVEYVGDTDKIRGIHVTDYEQPKASAEPVVEFE